MQAKDIPDIEMLRAVERCGRAGGVSDEPLLQQLPDGTVTDKSHYGHSSWAMVWDIELQFPAVPEKVVGAKLKTLMRRGLIDGCDCGCRGDWHLTEAGWRAWWDAGERTFPDVLVVYGEKGIGEVAAQALRALAAPPS